MSADNSAFAPTYVRSNSYLGQTGGLVTSVTVVGTNASATATSQFPGQKFNGFYQIRVTNKTSAYAHINFGVFGSITAATVAASPAVGPGTTEIFSVDPEVDGASVILDAVPSGSTSVIFTRGQGV